MSKSLPIIRYFNIELDKTQSVFSAGQLVKGFCHLHIDGELQLKNLDINLICEGFVDCKENKLDRDMMSLLIKKYDLMKRSATDQTLKGLITIDFCFNIPEKGYPSSFTGKFGFIRYKIEAIVHKDWDVFRKEVMLRVIMPYNGSANPVVIPIVRTAQKKFGVFKDIIELFAKVDKGWFGPGEKVSVYCNVDNQSDHKLKLNLSLHLKHDYYFTKIKSKISNKEIFDLIEPNCRSYSKRILLSIPSNLKTMSFESRIIKISFEIRVSVQILEYKKALKVELPIILTIKPKTCSEVDSDSQSLPPSYSDCQIFQRIASEDLCIPLFLDFNPTEDKDWQKYETKSEEPKSPVVVDLPPSYAEAVFGFDYKHFL